MCTIELLGEALIISFQPSQSSMWELIGFERFYYNYHGQAISGLLYGVFTHCSCSDYLSPWCIMSQSKHPNHL